MAGLAVAKLSIPVDAFYDMTPREFYYALKAKMNEEDNQFKSMMEAARFISMNIWNSAGKSLKKSITDPKKLLPFPWDKIAIKKQSAEEMKSILMGIARDQNRYVEEQEKRKKRKEKAENFKRKGS